MGDSSDAERPQVLAISLLDTLMYEQTFFYNNSPPSFQNKDIHEDDIKNAFYLWLEDYSTTMLPLIIEDKSDIQLALKDGKQNSVLSCNDDCVAS